ncbi:MAG TPA: glycerophosphodiester phosphodiesterase family protein, partial [Polyangiaceae bacterium]
IIDPALFDCTSLQLGPPTRKAASTPECLRDPKCTTRLVSAHRGAGGQLGRIAPEDTLAAYRAGIALGVDFVETDPRPTSDGVLVNLHDPSVDRTTDGTGNADQLTFAQIRALHVRSDGMAGDFSCEKVPTLRELLETCVGRAIVLVDGNKTDRVDLLVQAIHDANAVDWAIFDTSSTDKIDQALLLEPKLMIMPRVGAAADAPGILAHYKDHLPVIVEIDAAIFPASADVIRAAGTRAFTDAFGTDLSVKFGGDPSGYLDLYGKGADIVQSDLPDVVLKTLGRPVPPP